MRRFELGIIGAGNMAEAIVRGLLRAGSLAANSIIVSDVSPQRRQVFESQLHVMAVDDNAKVGAESRLLLLSVKPQQMAAALGGLSGVVSENTVIVSIAAAISTRFIENGLGGGRSWHVIRAMPNTPMLLGVGIAAICAGSHATAEDMRRARAIFESAAEVIETTEDKMDAVTAVSGSGPAYFFYLAEQMVKAAVEMGIPPDQAHRLAARTAQGAGKMLAESVEPPSELRRKVTSPGGTTQAAIEHLDKSAWPASTVGAIKAAAERSRQLGK
jgi:pyrroline-5-carboxylate reductase